MSDQRSASARAFLAEPAIHDEWKSDYLDPALEPFYELVFARLLAAMGAKPGLRILDAGCGSCTHAARLARAGLAVVGLDFSAAALETARETLARRGLAGSVELRQGDLCALPFRDGEFELVTCWGVLMHVPELERALDELARVLRSGGRLAVMENNCRSWQVRRWEPALRGVKRVLGRKVHRRQLTPRGIEEWREEGLMVRKLDPQWFTQAMRLRGLELVARLPGQFSEIYTSLPTKALKRAVMRFNFRWLERQRSCASALGNVFVFVKR
jgi:SAM-dependent methyltransferase